MHFPEIDPSPSFQTSQNTKQYGGESLFPNKEETRFLACTPSFNLQCILKNEKQYGGEHSLLYKESIELFYVLLRLLYRSPSGIF